MLEQICTDHTILCLLFPCFDLGIPCWTVKIFWLSIKTLYTGQYGWDRVMNFSGYLGYLHLAKTGNPCGFLHEQKDLYVSLDLNESLTLWSKHPRSFLEWKPFGEALQNKWPFEILQLLTAVHNLCSASCDLYVVQLWLFSALIIPKHVFLTWNNNKLF